EVGPEEGGEIADFVRADRQAREDRHAALPGEAAEALGIVRIAPAAVAVEVEAGGEAGIGAQSEAVRVGRGTAADQAVEGVEGDEAGVVVEAGEKKDVGIG